MHQTNPHRENVNPLGKREDFAVKLRQRKKTQILQEKRAKLLKPEKLPVAKVEEL